MAVTRRRFLTAVGGGLAGLILGIPLVGALVAPLFRPTVERVWIEAGPVDDLPVLEPRPFRLNMPVSGGADPVIEREVFAVRRLDGSFLVLLGECTHLGCPVRWLPERRLFYCPCHRGYFNALGHDVNGPPPRPLYLMEHRVENGVLFVSNAKVGGEV